MSKKTGEIGKELVTVAKKQGGEIERFIEKNDEVIRATNNYYDRLGGTGESIKLLLMVWYGDRLPLVRLSMTPRGII